MSGVPTPAGWYPDPGHAHEVRYFDGGSWTDHVSDRGTVSEAPLGPIPPGLVAWFPPAIMVQQATARPPLVAAPRFKMWTLAVLSAFVFWVRTPSRTIVIPLGVLFAIWCWRTTAAPLRSHEQAGSPAVTEIKIARWVAFGLGCFSILQIVLWTR